MKTTKSKKIKLKPVTRVGSGTLVRRLRWKIESYRRDAIPSFGWRVIQGNGLLIISELTKEMATRLAGDHNRCLPPNIRS